MFNLQWIRFFHLVGRVLWLGLTFSADLPGTTGVIKYTGQESKGSNLCPPPPQKKKILKATFWLCLGSGKSFYFPRTIFVKFPTRTAAKMQICSLLCLHSAPLYYTNKLLCIIFLECIRGSLAFSPSFRIYFLAFNRNERFSLFTVEQQYPFSFHYFIYILCWHFCGSCCCINRYF